ncbi:MAG: Wzz/FepE/Etk N-terminal domain-containing protein [Erysipelotrichaceae bacterium]|nr:Wzz/FepE/Etk N-terminal domain-containing protein [Erysipelotrichaceae bacterium]
MENNNFIEKVEIDEEDEIDLLEMAFELLDHWKAIAATTIVSALAVFAFCYFLVTPMYQSTAELYMLDSSNIISSLADIQIGNSLAADYIKVIESRPVVDKVINNLKLEDDYKSFSSRLSVTNDSNTHILKLTIKDADPKAAKTIVDELANVSRTFIADKMGQKEPSILHYGYIDLNKVSPSIKRNTLIGAAGGFVLSSAIVIASWLINDSIRVEEDVERKLGLGVLGVIPYEDRVDLASVKNKKRSKKVKKAVKK